MFHILRGSKKFDPQKVLEYLVNIFLILKFIKYLMNQVKGSTILKNYDNLLLYLIFQQMEC